MEHKMKIAVYTIAKDEEKHVERWAESAKDADYRFILDTGSTDKTVAKARKAGVQVAVATISPWRFDDARNAALALLPADTDMCIALDMDEILVKGWREELEKVKPETTRPRYQYTWSWNGDKPGLQYGGDKIHKRHGYRWKHPVHEVIVTDRSTEVQEWIGLEIHHHPDNAKSRGQYLPLLEVAVKEDPYDDRNAYYLAREYYFHGIIDKAIPEFSRHLSLPKAVWGPERAASYRYLAKCQPVMAEIHLQNAIKEAPGRREALVELSQFYYDNQQWGWCNDYANQAIEISKKPLDYLCEEFAWGALPYDLAAISAWNLGLKEDAILHTEKALEYEPNNERLLSNLGWYQRQ
jgi:glycosyltransferase involved in cell wall biosynthesis